MEVKLAPEIEAVVRDKVAAGEYPSVAALVEEALFLLVERDWHIAQRILHEQGGLALDRPETLSDSEGGP